MLSRLVKILTITLMSYFVAQTYSSHLRYQDKSTIIILIVFGGIFYFFPSYMNYIFGFFNHRRGYGGSESYPDIIWKILGLFFTFISLYLLMNHKIVNLTI